MNSLIDSLESNVRGYCRLFPATFQTARGSMMFDQAGKPYIDFFCGAGSLNYGHNNPRAKQAVLDYVQADGIQHSLDMTTTAKLRFMQSFQDVILRPRGLEYRMQFTGPTGTNAVEAALKLARRVTGRRHVIAFTHGYHGHTLGSLALTANSYYHHDAQGGRQDVSHHPFDGYFGDADTAEMLAKMIDDPSSGVPVPAAMVVETVQGEGGVNVARDEWLVRVAEICRRAGSLLIVDDIQVGNGRTGKFFSFEHAGVTPDIVCLSKSIGGGLPLSVLLMRPELDVWKPGQHTGTFRGNNLAFVAATAVLSHWEEAGFENQVAHRSQLVRNRLTQIVGRYETQMSVRGRGMIWGVDVRDGGLARRIIDRAFDAGLLLEASGADDEVLKVMPALTIPLPTLEEGLAVLDDSIAAAMHTCEDDSALPAIITSSTALSSPASPATSSPASPATALSSLGIPMLAMTTSPVWGVSNP